jgi:hypothetical protein
VSAAVFAAILMLGGHYTYARMPLGDWVREAFDLARNHYDRLGHFAQGFIPAIAVREILLRQTPLCRDGWLFTLVAATCLAISAFYEFLRVGIARNRIGSVLSVKGFVSAMPSPTMSHAAAELIRRYFAAYLRGDSTAYADCWVYPAASFSGGVWRTVATPAQMAQGNDEYTRMQRERGVVGGDIVSLEVQSLGREAASVRGRFTRTDHAGAVIETVTATYLAVVVAGEWRVAVCVVEAP